METVLLFRKRTLPINDCLPSLCGSEAHLSDQVDCQRQWPGMEEKATNPNTLFGHAAQSPKVRENTCPCPVHAGLGAFCQ